MSSAERVAARIEKLSDLSGALAAFLALAMILIGAYNAVVRYLGPTLGTNLSSNAYIELQWYCFSLVFLLGAPYALRRDAHVRVDVLYGRLGPRARAWIDFLGSLIFTIPFCLFTLWLSWPAVVNSFRIREQSSDPGGLARYPIKAMILVAFSLLILQGIASAIRSWGVLRSGAPRDVTGDPGEVADESP